MFTVSDYKTVMAERRQWLSGSPFRVCSIMYDRSDGSLWADCFLDCNTWSEYHSPDIFDLTALCAGRDVVNYDSLSTYAALLDSGMNEEDFY